MVVMKRENRDRRTIPLNNVAYELLSRKRTEGKEHGFVFTTDLETELKRDIWSAPSPRFRFVQV